MKLSDDLILNVLPRGPRPEDEESRGDYQVRISGAESTTDLEDVVVEHYPSAAYSTHVVFWGRAFVLVAGYHELDYIVQTGLPVPTTHEISFDGTR